MDSYSQNEGPVTIAYTDEVGRLLTLLNGGPATVLDTTGRLSGQDVTIARIDEETARSLFVR